jgi:CRP-like cAMP-binding protein
MPVNVQALEESQILFIDREKLLKLMEKYPEICLKISKVLSQRLYHLVSLVEILTLNSAMSRLARYILSMAKGNILDDFKTSLVAMHLGLTPEAVSRAVSQLRKEGIIEKEGKRIIMLEPEELKMLAGLF